MAADVLSRLYGLTPCEAELAAELVAGKTLAQFASETERNIETARKTLKHIFAKTDTNPSGRVGGSVADRPGRPSERRLKASNTSIWDRRANVRLY